MCRLEEWAGRERNRQRDYLLRFGVPVRRRQRVAGAPSQSDNLVKHRNQRVRLENMGKKRKKHGPRRKRMNRSARLQSAKSTQWVKNYSGKNIVRGYCKWYGVDPLCAVAELRQLGVPITAEREEELRRSVAAQAAARATRRQKRNEKEWDEYSESDDTYAYIAGYTSWGFPYGVTWEEIGETPPWMDDDEDEKSDAG